MKTAILAISFGTTHLDTLEKTIQATEQELAKAFPECTVFRAFTSGIVRKRLQSKYGIHVASVAEAIEQIASEGFTRVIAQPMLLLAGEEYDKLCTELSEHAGAMRVHVGAPLLCTEDDIRALIDIIRASYPTAPDTALVLMGHGTDHSANAIYLRMADMLAPHPIRLCTVEGTPSFDDVVQSLKSLSQKKLLVAPMLFVAGDHAKNDMAGDAPTSLRSLLEANGYHVTCIIQGLGELPQIRARYIENAKKASEA